MAKDYGPHSKQQGMSPGEARSRGLGAQHHGSTTSGSKTQATESKGQTSGHVPGIGYVPPGQKTKVTADKAQIKTDTSGTKGGTKGGGGGAWGLWPAIKQYAHTHNLKRRTKFAVKEGLTRDWAKTHQWSKTPTLDVMSKPGKDYLKEAGYGPFQDKPLGAEGGNQDIRCPDGNMPPCPPVATTAPTSTESTSTSTPTNTGWKFYPTNSNYITGEGYDEGGGVRFGPPPTKGPNPQVPPIKFSRGGGAAIRGTKFSGVK